MQINPQKLIFLRNRAGWSTQKLAEESQLGRATITRIENGHTRESNSHTVTQLSRVFRCRAEELSTPPDADDVPERLSDRRAPKEEMSAATRNAVSLIALRYGEKPSTILELAPLLFDLVAKESLIDRRKSLNEVRGYRQAIEAVADRFPHMGSRFTYDYEVDQFELREERSIAREDIRGEYVHADASYGDALYPDDYDDASNNPFVRHLQKRCEQISAEGFEAPRIEAIPRWYSPDYEIGLAEADGLSGGDAVLSKAILQGIVSLSSIPDELKKSGRVEARQQWMRERVDENRRKVAEYFEKNGMRLRELGIDLGE